MIGTNEAMRLTVVGLHFSAHLSALQQKGALHEPLIRVIVHQHNITIHPKRTTAIKKIAASPLVEKMLRKSEQGLPETKKNPWFLINDTFATLHTFD